MPTAPLTSPAKQKKKQSHARSVIQQILNEPIEIAKTATRQIVGGETVEKQTEQSVQGVPLHNQEDLAKKQNRDRSHYQAFQNELAEIRRIQKQREQERQQLRMQEEQQKQAKIEQVKKKEQEGLIEPVARKARGMLGGIGLKRKQTQVEIQKTPSN